MSARDRRGLTLIVLGWVVVAIAACTPTGSAGASPAIAGASPATGDAYCASKGGKVVERVATWNTNADPSAWLTLAGHLRLCEFETGSGDSTTRISVDLTTLSSTTPTLAAIAYLSKVPTPQPPQAGQNPAEYDCTTALRGSADFGNTAAAGGGWVATAEPVFKVMNLCVFADMSAIDEFGIWYYANGIVRGADLAPLLAYQPNGKLPAVFQPVRP